jgi:hypothetical protein
MRGRPARKLVNIKAKLSRLIYEALVNKEIRYPTSKNRMFCKLRTGSLIT